MIKLVILFHRNEHEERMKEYLYETYIPNMKTIYGLKSVDIIDLGFDPIADLANQESFIPYFFQLIFTFETMADFKQATSDPNTLQITQEMFEVIGSHNTMMFGRGRAFHKGELIELQNKRLLDSMRQSYKQKTQPN